MRRLVFGLLVLGLPVLATAPVAAAATSDPVPASKAFEGWTATCNNLDACVATAASQEDLFYLRIARDAGATAPVVAKIVLSPSEALDANPAVFKLSATTDGRTSDLGAFPAKGGKDDPFESELDGEAAGKLVDGLRNADDLAYAIGSAKGTLALKGLAAALRWIDARQGRAGTPTALVARGMTPIGQVPAARAVPVVHAAPPGSTSEIAKPVLSPALLQRAAAVADCEADVVKAHEDAQAWQLGPNLVLVAVPCTRGAYNFSSALFFTDAEGADPRPADLPQPVPDADASANVIVNGEFDTKTNTLADFSKGRGIGDCGQTRSWVWTGQDFAALEISELDACPGALSEDWPNLYTARRQ